MSDDRTKDAVCPPVEEVAAKLVEGLSRLVPTGKAAQVLSIHTRTLKRWIADGRLRAVKTSGGRSGKMLIPVSEIERLLRVMLT